MGQGDIRSKSNFNTGKVNNKISKIEDIAMRQDTLPDSQNESQNVQDDIRPIINRILSIAKEIGWLSEHKAPVENDNVKPISRVFSQ